MINFIGVGAQKSGTSWVYACLYEHPEICAPIKELHFFSRPRFSKGKDWYEAHFDNCRAGTLRGEFSTSYLYSEDAPARIQALYPEVKLIAILRNPVDRAYSQYRNAIKAGEIARDVTPEEYFEEVPSACAQGMYAEQLQRYFDIFSKEQILVVIYEDIQKDPKAFMQRIYQFLGVDDTFVPSMLFREVNVARVPRFVLLDRIMHWVAEGLRTIGLDRLVWFVKKSGISDTVRSINTQEGRETERTEDRISSSYFREDVTALSRLLDRDLVTEWKL